MIIQNIKTGGGVTLEKIVIEGKTRLRGEVEISGAKNAAVAILPATILVNGISILENVPDISDIKTFCEILESLGVKIRKISKNTLEIDSREIKSVEAPLRTNKSIQSILLFDRSLTFKMQTCDSRNARRV